MRLQRSLGTKKAKNHCLARHIIHTFRLVLSLPILVGVANAWSSQIPHAGIGSGRCQTVTTPVQGSGFWVSSGTYFETENFRRRILNVEK